MKPDPIICGGFAGILGTIAKEIIDLVDFSIGWSKILYWHLAASVFVLPRDVNKFGALIIGALGDMITGAFFGIVLLYLIKFTGKNYYYLKGLGLGWIVWLTLFGVFVDFHIVRITPTDIGTSLCAFGEHSVYGLVVAWSIVKFGSKFLRSDF